MRLAVHVGQRGSGDDVCRAAGMRQVSVVSSAPGLFGFIDHKSIAIHRLSFILGVNCPFHRGGQVLPSVTRPGGPFRHGYGRSSELLRGRRPCPKSRGSLREISLHLGCHTNYIMACATSVKYVWTLGGNLFPRNNSTFVALNSIQSLSTERVGCNCQVDGLPEISDLPSSLDIYDVQERR